MDDWDLPRAGKAPAIVLGEPLGKLSITELEGRVEALRQEIARIEAEIGTKKALRDQAASIFKD